MAALLGLRAGNCSSWKRFDLLRRTSARASPTVRPVVLGCPFPSFREVEEEEALGGVVSLFFFFLCPFMDTFVHSDTCVLGAEGGG